MNVHGLSVLAKTESAVIVLSLLFFLPTPTEQSKLEEMVGELSQGLAVVKHEQEYMEVRERIHRMSESIKSTQLHM